MMRNALSCLLVLGLASCATPQSPPPATSATPSAPAATSPAETSVERVADVPPEALKPVDFATARAQFVRDTAAKYGIPPTEIDATLAKAQFLDSVVAAMSRPAERVKPWSEYRVGFLTQARIDGGRKFIAAHRDELSRVEQQYGVPAEVIVSIIGVETFYGGNTGSWRVLDALSTLCFDYPPRAEFFCQQLREFLRVRLDLIGDRVQDP